MGKQDPIGRRRFVRAATGTLGIGTIASVATARPDQRQQNSNGGSFTTDNGELQFEPSDAGRTGNQPRVASQSTRGQVNRIQNGVARLNELRDSGLVEFHNRDGQVRVSFTQKMRMSQANSFSSPSSSSVNTLGCGKTKYDTDFQGYANEVLEHEIYLDDEDTEYLIYRLKQGGALITVLGGIAGVFSSGIGAALAAILAGGIGLSVIELEHENEGCGIAIKIHHYVGSPYPYWVDVVSQ